MGGRKLDLTNSQDVLLKYIQKPDGSGLPLQCRRKSSLPVQKVLQSRANDEADKWDKVSLIMFYQLERHLQLNCFWKINYWLQSVHISCEGGSVDSPWPVRLIEEDTTGKPVRCWCKGLRSPLGVTIESTLTVHHIIILSMCWWCLTVATGLISPPLIDDQCSSPSKVRWLCLFQLSHVLLVSFSTVSAQPQAVIY